MHQLDSTYLHLHEDGVGGSCNLYLELEPIILCGFAASENQHDFRPGQEYLYLTI